MEAIIIFLTSFFGTFSAIFFYHFLTRYNESSFVKQGLSRALHAVKKNVLPPKGEVLHSPTPEEEEKELEKEVIKKFMQNKEKIIQDFRK